MLKKRSKSCENYSKKIFCARHPESTRYSQLHEFCETSDSSDENSYLKTDATNQNKSDSSFDEDIKNTNSKQIEVITSLIIKKGMPANRLKTKEDLMLIAKFIEQGATAAIVSQAYDFAARITPNQCKEFDISYLSKIVGSLLKKQGINYVINGNGI